MRLDAFKQPREHTLLAQQAEDLDQWITGKMFDQIAKE